MKRHKLPNQFKADKVEPESKWAHPKIFLPALGALVIFLIVAVADWSPWFYDEDENETAATFSRELGDTDPEVDKFAAESGKQSAEESEAIESDLADARFSGQGRVIRQFGQRLVLVRPTQVSPPLPDQTLIVALPTTPTPDVGMLVSLSGTLQEYDSEYIVESFLEEDEANGSELEFAGSWDYYLEGNAVPIVESVEGT